MQERYSDSGFSVIGVMVDQNVDTVRQAIEAGDVTWPCIWDGPSGPIADTFRVRAYPTILLLDRDRRITALGIQTEEHLVAQIERDLRGD